MDKQPYVSYSKSYKPKDISEVFPEYLAYWLKNKDKNPHQVNHLIHVGNSDFATKER